MNTACSRGSPRRNSSWWSRCSNTSSAPAPSCPRNSCRRRNRVSRGASRARHKSPRLVRRGASPKREAATTGRFTHRRDKFSTDYCFDVLPAGVETFLPAAELFFFALVVAPGGSGCGLSATLLSACSPPAFLSFGGNGCGFNSTLLAGSPPAFLSFGGSGCGFSDTLSAGDTVLLFSPGGSGCGLSATLLSADVLLFADDVLVFLSASAVLSAPAVACAHDRLAASKRVTAIANSFFISLLLSPGPSVARSNTRRRA